MAVYLHGTNTVFYYKRIPKMSLIMVALTHELKGGKKQARIMEEKRLEGSVYNLRQNYTLN